jgi:hypothetical protein
MPSADSRFVAISLAGNGIDLRGNVNAVYPVVLNHQNPASPMTVGIFSMPASKTKTFTLVGDPTNPTPASGAVIYSGPTPNGPWVVKDNVTFNSLAAGAAAEKTFQDAAQFWKIDMTPDTVNDLVLTLYVVGYPV